MTQTPRVPFDVADGLPPLAGEQSPRTSGVRTVPRSAETLRLDQDQRTDPALETGGALPGACDQCGARFERNLIGFRHSGCGRIVDAEAPDPMHGIPAGIGVDIPITWRPDYLGQPRAPEPVTAAKGDEMNRREAEEEARDRGGLGGDPAQGDRRGGGGGRITTGIYERPADDADRATGPDPAGAGRTRPHPGSGHITEVELPLPFESSADRPFVSMEEANRATTAVDAGGDPRPDRGGGAGAMARPASAEALEGDCQRTQPATAAGDPDLGDRPVDRLVTDPPLVDEPLWGDTTPPFTYLAGPAGCGKTFAVKAWQQRERGLMLLATTGIAALNLGGTTVNAALGYFDTKALQENYTNGYLTARLGRLWKSGIQRLILDEVSMLEGDALTYLVKGIEEVNERGYVIGKWSNEDTGEPPSMGLTLVGDFAQLPPVNGTFAWESPEWPRFAETGHTITLTEIRRQHDPGFVQMLRAARVGDGPTVRDFLRGAIHAETDDSFDGPTLFAKNQAVDRYNWIRLGRLPGRDCYFESRREGDQRSEWGNPKKPPNTWGIPLRLHVKIGALVMVLANEREEGPPPQSFIYVNGDLGTVVEADETSAIVKLKRNNREVVVTYCRREVTIPCDAARRKELRDQHQEHRITENGKFEITGWIEYMPLRVGYGSTVHKCVAADTRVNIGHAITTISALCIGTVLQVGGPVQALAATTRHGYRITTARGYTIVASAEHRWETPGAWVTTLDLYHLQKAPGGFPSIALCVGACGGGLTEDHYAWWLGAMVGNGTYNDRRESQLHFSTTSTQLGARWRQLTLEMGARTVSWRKDQRGLHTTSRGLRLRLLADGLDYVTCRAKRIPQYIWAGGPSAWRSFIRGLFDCTGSVSRSGIVWTTASEGLGIEVHELLLALGVVSDRRGYQGKVDPYWQVRISAAGLDAFREIGFWHPEKAQALSRLHPNRIIKSFEGYDAVTTVQDLHLILSMVDVEVTAPHVIGTGPFRSHNSQGLSLDAVQVNIRDQFFKTPGMLYVALSRARTAAGLRLVGSEAALLERCVADPRLKAWL
jgi:hypothetical protein